MISFLLILSFSDEYFIFKLSLSQRKRWSYRWENYLIRILSSCQCVCQSLLTVFLFNIFQLSINFPHSSLSIPHSYPDRSPSLTISFHLWWVYTVHNLSISCEFFTDRNQCLHGKIDLPSCWGMDWHTFMQFFNILTNVESFVYLMSWYSFVFQLTRSPLHMFS